MSVVVAQPVRQHGAVVVTVDSGRSGTHEQGTVTFTSSMQSSVVQLAGGQPDLVTDVVMTGQETAAARLEGSG